ncbi:hypothetical protein [Ponticaulis sp.]|uniref:hypothetical protein n=1 Tax=Ponticaulis sp. TaxID=2020902 RepID=UPI000B6DB93B|nr:hypothetical protein [Ponticaulis sp.]MAJ07663.1 hypothetical protein [Ponticaulis sp.]RPG17889.1 MAG: hypothetical protein CBC85_004930 [Hyphomonadaceae bacterium TMED125]HBH90083.1 hypothetical protein [Hyphomonadaceae bacterium]HBJ91547.1 hypothetical protein [Hyphomonadaceae bacterium]
MSRFDDLVETAKKYQDRAAENYDRIRKLASELKDGFCQYLGTGHGVCVHLVPPVGQFQPKTDLDTAFSIPPRGFRPLGPVLFGLAVRVSEGMDWIRVVMHCHKQGERFMIAIDHGPNYTFKLPLSENDPSEFYDLLYRHITSQFTEAIERYDRGTDARSIGFDFSDPNETA